jgi:hypothetical protein
LTAIAWINIRLGFLQAKYWVYTLCMGTQKKAITVGSHVELNLIDRNGKKDLLSIDIVEDESADFSQGYLGKSTPLARVLFGEKPGVTIPYLKDDILAIEILSVSASSNIPPDDAQAKRQEKLKHAMQQVQHTNAVVFASSFTGKWGDYDPDSLGDELKPKRENNPE